MAVLPSALWHYSGSNGSGALIGLGPNYPVLAYGAKCDGMTLTDVTTTATSATISSASHTFVAGDVGKLISVGGGGVVATATGTRANGSALITSITTTGLYPGMYVTGTGIAAGTTVLGNPYGASELILSAGATASGTSVLSFWPPLNTTISSVSAGNAVLASAVGRSISGIGVVTFGTEDDIAINLATTAAAATKGQVIIPNGKCIIAATISLPTGVSIRGQEEVGSSLFWLSASDMAGNPMIGNGHSGSCSLVGAQAHSDNHVSYLELDASAATDATPNVQSKGVSLPCSVRARTDHTYIHDIPATCLAQDSGIPEVTEYNTLVNCGRIRGAAGEAGANGIGNGISENLNEQFNDNNNIVINPAHYGVFVETQGLGTTYYGQATANGNTIMFGPNTSAPNGGECAGIGDSGIVGYSVAGNNIYGYTLGTHFSNCPGISEDSGTYATGGGVGLTASGNFIYNTGDGISVSYAQAVPTSGLKANVSLSGNNIYNVNGLGIRVQPAASSTAMGTISISGGNIVGSGDAGIGIVAVSNADTVSNVSISGVNLIDNGATTATGYRQSGIALNAAVTGLTITGVTATDDGAGTQKYGIGVNTGASITGAVITGNNLTGNVTSAVLNNGTLTGVINNNNGWDSGTTFTMSGCSASSPVGSASIGQFTSGTSGTCTVTITFNGATGFTAPNGWVCVANDLTTTTDKVIQTASSTTTATISGTTVSGDVINFRCNYY